MKYLIAILLGIFAFTANAQETKFKLQNVLIVGLFDKLEDQYTIEGNLGEMFSSMGIKTKLSLNTVKQGSSRTILANDSIQNLLKANGVDTYVLISVRGYDRTFKPASKIDSLEAELSAGHLFPLYRDNISSITLEFNFYRNGQHVKYDMLKLGGIGSRESVVKKLHKKLPKKIAKDWK